MYVCMYVCFFLRQTTLRDGWLNLIQIDEIRGARDEGERQKTTAGTTATGRGSRRERGERGKGEGGERRKGGGEGEGEGGTATTTARHGALQYGARPGRHATLGSPPV